MYKRFYFRPKVYARMIAEMLTERQMFARRIREGMEFASYVKDRKAEVRKRTSEAVTV